MNSFKIACTGYEVNADWYDGASSDRVLLMLTGWTSSRKRYENIANHLVRNTGMSALVLEYSGHGESPIDVNSTRPAQHFLEVICAFDWIKQNYPHAKITVIGTSYGGFMAAELTKYRSFDKLVLRAPAIYRPSDFYSLQPDIDREWTNKVFRRDKAALANHPLLAQASKFAGKTLVIVHENDTEVPKATTDAYIKTFGADVYLAKEFPHSTSEVPQSKMLEYQNAISEWLNKN